MSSIVSYSFNNTTNTQTAINNDYQIPTPTDYPLSINRSYTGLGVLIGYPTQNTSTVPSSGNINYGVYLNSSTTTDYTYSSITTITLTNNNYFPINIIICSNGGYGGTGPPNVDNVSNYTSYPGGGGSGGNCIIFTINSNTTIASSSSPIIFTIYTQLSNDTNNLTSTLIIGNNNASGTDFTNVNTFTLPAVSNGGNGSNEVCGTGSSSTSGISFNTIAYDTYTVDYTILSTDVVGGTESGNGYGSAGITINTPYLSSFYVCGAGCAGQSVVGANTSAHSAIFSATAPGNGGGGNGGYQPGTGNGYPATYFGGGGGAGASSIYTTYGTQGGIGCAPFALIYTAAPSST